MRQASSSDGVDDLYVIESSCGHVKIGRGRNVDQRLRALQLMCPPSVKLSILAIAKLHGDWEYGMHDVFAAHRIQGEWFSKEVGDRIRELLGRAHFEVIVREIAKRHGRTKAQTLTGPNDRRGAEWVRARRQREASLRVQQRRAR